MGVSNKEAKKIISDFFERFPKVADFVVDSQNGAWENGYVETIAGRKRRLPDMQLDEYEFKPMNGAKNENFDPLNFDDDEEIDLNYVPQRIIDKYGKSAICMFSINNIEEINEKIGRKVGTELIIQVANTVKTNISSEYIFSLLLSKKSN